MLAQQDTISKGKKDKKVQKILIPTITYNNSFKAIFGFIASGFYKLQANDTVSPLSTSSLKSFLFSIKNAIVY